jgi:hypothetical protein
MKEAYTKPVSEAEKFAQVDVITTSSETTTSPKVDVGDGDDD